MDGRFRLFLLCLFAAKPNVSVTELNQISSGSGTGSFYFYGGQMYPRDCKEAQDQLCTTHNSTGVHLVQPAGYHEPFWVSCSGEWTVLQRRLEGFLDFNRNWSDYRNGFGFLKGEHWLGNEKLSYLTSQGDYELRIEFETASGQTVYISYEKFRINDEFSGYSLVALGQSTGTMESEIMECPPNMVPGNCDRCIATCADPSGTVDCSNDCTDKPKTCNCPLNYLMDGNSCVRQEQCGCYRRGYGVVMDNHSYMTSDCSERCTCNSGVLTCVTSICDQEATCKIVEGVRDCYCIDDYEGDGQTCTRQIRDCYDLQRLRNSRSGEYTITPTGWNGESFTIYCNMTIDDGGWTVFQRRIQSSSRQNFNRTWVEYKNGFGALSDEFWLGNDKLHFLTNQKEYELRIDMVNWYLTDYYAKYDFFRINGESDKYRLIGLGNFTGTAAFDAFRYQQYAAFSTPDRDNDLSIATDCSNEYGGGWWYNSPCYYHAANFQKFSTAVGHWDDLSGSGTLKYTEMKIRPTGANH